MPHHRYVRRRGERAPTLLRPSHGKEADTAGIPPIRALVTGGVDTHQDQHVAAVVGVDERVPGTASFPTTRAGYRQSPAWMRRFGRLERVGIEGTGCHGAGLPRHLRAQGVQVLQVTRPDRADRRRRGRDDTLDALGAARAAHAGRRVVTPENGDGAIEAPRVLRRARTSAVIAHREAMQPIHAQILTAPADLRDHPRAPTRMRLPRTCAALRPDPAAAADPRTAVRPTPRSPPERTLYLHRRIRDLDALMQPPVRRLAPSLPATRGFATHTTTQLPVTMGDNPERITTEARFAKLCGLAPPPASCGLIQRHRPGRGGDRQANSAPHTALVNRPHYDEHTRDHIARRTAEGRTKPEAIRCLIG